jgi:hypothetical protein
MLGVLVEVPKGLFYSPKAKGAVAPSFGKSRFLSVHGCIGLSVAHRTTLATTVAESVDWLPSFRVGTGLSSSALDCPMTPLDCWRADVTDVDLATNRWLSAAS